VPAIVRELPDGSLQLLDGHLRAEEMGEGEITVAVTDLNDEEARKALATIDPVSSLAERDQAILDDLLAGVESASEAVAGMLEDLLSKEAKLQDELPAEPPLPDEKFEIVVECQSEAEQRSVYEALQRDGYKCKVLTF